MKKYKINYRRFIPFIIICILIIALLFFGATKLLNKSKCDHSFVDGVCEKCGVKDKNYIPPISCEHEYEVKENGTLGACIKCGDIPENTHPYWPNSVSSKEDYPLSKVINDILVLINKEYHVTSSYYPSDLVKFDRYVEGVGTDETHQLRAVAASSLNQMFDAALEDGIHLKLRTGFRSYEYQDSLYNSYVQNHGEEEANKFSAKPGESEHQSGLAADLAGESQGYILSDYFGETPEGKWVKDNCYRYGFILRYTDGTLDTVGEHTGYIYEAWHVRYVGLAAAYIMHENGWTLEEYLEEVNNPTNNYVLSFSAAE